MHTNMRAIKYFDEETNKQSNHYDIRARLWKDKEFGRKISLLGYYYLGIITVQNIVLRYTLRLS